MYKSIFFSVFTELFKHHHNQIENITITPFPPLPEKPHIAATPLRHDHFVPNPQDLATTDLLSVFIDLPILDT